jgi:hypothetical protein
MANREACELYIEQEIKEQLAQGKKPWSIGKELSKWVEKMFETTINPRTIEQRVRRIEKKDNATFVAEKSQPIETIEYSKPEIIENRKPQGGGEREGAGRPLNQVSNAMQFAAMAISQLDRIQPQDPHKTDAFNKVIEYCQARKENK